jgi:hypothetical protein
VGGSSDLLTLNVLILLVLRLHGSSKLQAINTTMEFAVNSNTHEEMISVSAA